MGIQPPYYFTLNKHRHNGSSREVQYSGGKLVQHSVRTASRRTINKEISLESVLTRGGYCTRKIIAIAKKALYCMAQRPGHYRNWRRSIWRTSKCGAEGE